MDKTVLITGASKGIGLALTKKFLKNNFKVIGTCRTGIMDEIKDSNFEVLKLDLSNPDSIINFEQSFQTKQISIDILINNAGIGPDLDFDLPEEKSFKQTFDVNVTGATFLQNKFANT